MSLEFVDFQHSYTLVSAKDDQDSHCPQRYQLIMETTFSPRKQIENNVGQ